MSLMMALALDPLFGSTDIGSQHPAEVRKGGKSPGRVMSWKGGPHLGASSFESKLRVCLLHVIVVFVFFLVALFC